MVDKRDWMRLPLHLRQRFWKETDYNRNPPSDELAEKVRIAIAASKADEQSRIDSAIVRAGRAAL